MQRALFGASYCYKKYFQTQLTTATNQTIFVLCIGESFWYKFLERVSPLLLITILSCLVLLIISR